MSLILKQAITGPEAWKGADMAGDTSWLHPLSVEAIASLDTALARVKARGLTFANFGRQDFPIGDWALALTACSNELENGRAKPVASVRVRPCSTAPALVSARSARTFPFGVGGRHKTAIGFKGRCGLDRLVQFCGGVSIRISPVPLGAPWAMDCSSWARTFATCRVSVSAVIKPARLWCAGSGTVGCCSGLSTPCKAMACRKFNQSPSYWPTSSAAESAAIMPFSVR